MEEYPDSSLVLLDRIATPEIMSRKHRALYALLLTQAEDKNYFTHTSDSLIQTAVEYYKHSWNKEKRAQAYFYLGSVYRDLEMPVEQVEAFQEALKAKGKKEDRLTALICNNLATLYRKQDFYEEAIEIGKKAIHISSKLNNQYDKAHFSRNLGISFYLAEKEDSALHYYKKALTITRTISNNKLESIILAEIGDFYHNAQQIDSAHHYLTKSIQGVPREKANIFTLCTLGRIFHSLNELDSARSYLLLCINSENIYMRAESRSLLSEIEKQSGNLEKAIKYNDDFLAIQDTLHANLRRKETSQIINQQIEPSNKREIQKAAFNISGIIISVLAILFLSSQHKKKKKRKQLTTQSIPAKELTLLLSSNGPLFTTGVNKLSKTSCYHVIKQFIQNENAEIHLPWEERNKLERKVLRSFVDIRILLKSNYPRLTKDDLFCCILYLLRCKTTAVRTIMCVESGALRVRRARIRQKIHPVVYEFIFGKEN